MFLLYAKVEALTFSLNKYLALKISDQEFAGDDYEQLEGVFGLHIRVVRMQLGDEQIELTDYLTSGGRSIPEDSKRKIIMSRALVFHGIGCYDTVVPQIVVQHMRIL